MSFNIVKRFVVDYVKKDLRMAMLMTCCDSLEEVSREILFLDEKEGKLK
ncbi:MAG: hypothetical protein ABSG33_02390 [Candidatus Bathyarchaeia archaeon]